MNVFIVRTRLQSLIVEKIINVEDISKYILVFCYLDNKYEDDSEYYTTYKRIRKNAFFTINVFCSSKISVNFTKFFLTQLMASITNGKVFLAVIDSYPFALSNRFFPSLEVNTFDDGSYNVIQSSKYFDETALARKGIKGFISKMVFPSGGAKYLRGRTKRHYTVFPNLDNIVEKDRVVNLDWDWSELLDSRDLDKLLMNTNTILLGTAFQDFSIRQQIKLKKNIMKIIDDVGLYIMHPREESWFENKKAVKLHSPAEAVLKHIQSTNNNELTVYHIDTTVSYSLKGNEHIRFIDLLSEV
ncbi:beta-galactosamide-alpha-2,3-sialyltransferase [Psychrobacter luti]|uniref:Beta-galactosamide-alpha-2,3-sialyltransferase n=1 Tax=Psychrobacter luti TaxID=198481 RepID=A0A839TEV7_9GAMM|nr:glycosyltransferase family 52 [Psychrobacter luti]MBB3107748.1 beta-galactosamide-alpha-2,3-sialyltransferase [Psychrobacter luti]